MSILGHVDELREGVVCGWAYDDRMSGEPVDIILRSGGADLGSIKADVYRDDLAKAGIGKGYHAFYFRLSPRHLRPGASIEVYAGSELWPIPGGQLKVAGTDAVGPAESFPEERSTPQREMQRLFAEGLAEWGKAAFESLPRFIANAAGSGGGRQIGTNEFGTLDAIVKRVTNDFSAIELPFLEAPVASIIIPTFNQFELTYNCIKSLHATGTSALAEIIVADDASTDAIVMLSSLVKNLRVSRNATNLGFLRNCNAAAKMARGEFLIFLNNDTLVLDGWLEPILASFSKFSTAGIVGSKLLYEDRVLQEAGGILWADGSAWNFGNRADARAPEFNYVRDVDYVSGASLAIRRGVWLELAGFDERYVPAYCEDADLCLRASSAGYRVLYQPFSQVIHLEGKSHGVDIGKGVKEYQALNSRRLYDRWRDYLSVNGQNGERPWMNKDRRWIGRALVVDAVTPTPDRDAGSVAAFAQMLILRDLGYKISFIPEDNFADVGTPTRLLQEEGIECVYGPYICSVDEWLEKYGSTVDIIHVYRYKSVEKYYDIFKRYAPQARIIYSNADMHSLRMDRQAAIDGDADLAAEAAHVRELELRYHRSVDCSIVTSDVEAQLIAEEVPDANVCLLRWINEIVEPHPRWEGRECIAFLGGYNHTPNVDAVDYFMTAIFPEVLKAVPSIQFLICGGDAPERFRAYESGNVQVVGWVADLAPLFARCIATVAPLRYGAGFKGKVATSLAHGLPCVGTQIAIEGTGLCEGDGFLTMKSPRDYARTILKLHRNGQFWSDLSHRGLSAVERLYSRRAAIEAWKSILTDLDLSVRES